MVDKPRVNEEWARFLNGDERLLRIGQKLFRPLPSPPRCTLCYAPFKGPFRGLLKLMMKDPWPRNPNICRFCGNWLAKKGPGGAHVELSLMFADIRGSTRLAETLSSADYVSLINRFYESASAAFVRHGAIIDQLVGDGSHRTVLARLRRGEPCQPWRTGLRSIYSRRPATVAIHRRGCRLESGSTRAPRSSGRWVRNRISLSLRLWATS